MNNDTETYGYQSICSAYDSRFGILCVVEDIIKQVGRRIKEIRKSRGFASQEAFAVYMKKHRTAIGHLEVGRKDFRLTTLITVAQALDVTLSELFAGVEGEPVKRRKATKTSTSRYALLKEAALMESAAKRLRALAD
jgi:transcriptional regulator with XRE-family HTH domain